MEEIPISAAKAVAEKYGFDQIIIIGRKVDSHEHVTTYGIDKANCAAAAKIGDHLKYKVMGWPKECTCPFPDSIYSGCDICDPGG